MKEYQSLSHTRWDCKYHVVFIPKKRKKRIFGVLRKHLGEIFHELATHKESKIVEGHMMPDHVHMCISIPPKYAVSNVVGYLKGKSAIAIDQCPPATYPARPKKPLRTAAYRPSARRSAPAFCWRACY